MASHKKQKVEPNWARVDVAGFWPDGEWAASGARRESGADNEMNNRWMAVRWPTTCAILTNWPRRKLTLLSNDQPSMERSLKSLCGRRQTNLALCEMSCARARARFPVSIDVFWRRQQSFPFLASRARLALTR